MREVKLTAGVEFEDKYTEAMRKMFDFKKAFDELNPAEKERFVNEVVSATDIAVFLEQLGRVVNHGKRG